MASMEDYLEDGFDPSKTTMPRLRSILVTHEISFPSNAKKGQLVDMVNEFVMPQVAKLRAKRERVQRSSFGIVNAGSVDDVPNWDDDLTPARPGRRSKTPRKSSAKIKSEEPEPSTLLRSAPRRQSRSASRQISTADSDEQTPQPPKSSRRVSHRPVTPPVKDESDEDEEGYDEEVSVFTSDNPFQGGSSPSRRTSSNRRRTGDSVVKSGKSSRRTTEEYAETPRARTSVLRVPKTRPRSISPELDPELEPGEEFTPGEQLELEEAARNGEVVPARTASRKNVRKTSFTAPLVVLFLTLFGAYAAWYRQEKLAVGYCGVGRAAKELLPPDIPVPEALLPFVEPQCEKCPPHAYCFQDMVVSCDQDFVLKPHPLSLFGLVPLPPTCEPDSDKAAAVKAVADKAIEELRDRRAKFECGELIDDAGKQQDSPAIAEEELKSTVSSQRNKQRLNTEQFEDLWKAAIGEVTAMEEVVVVETPASNSTGLSKRRLSSTSLARVSLICQARRSFRHGLGRLRLPIGLLGFLTFVYFYVRARYRKHIKITAQIPSLVDSVLGRLANQKELGEEEIDEPWLFLPNLRDDVLRTVHSLSERERIWQKVKAVVELNSNVRTSQREGRNGEVGRAWEWIGPTGGDVSVRRRRSGRVSWGADVKSDTPERETEPAEVKKWEEPRPIY